MQKPFMSNYHPHTLLREERLWKKIESLHFVIWGRSEYWSENMSNFSHFRSKEKKHNCFKHMLCKLLMSPLFKYEISLNRPCCICTNWNEENEHAYNCEVWIKPGHVSKPVRWHSISPAVLLHAPSLWSRKSLPVEFLASLILAKPPCPVLRNWILKAFAIIKPFTFIYIERQKVIIFSCP